MESEKLTFKNVWATLNKIDCSEHIQKKNNLSYLSWAWAWQIMMESYPQVYFEFLDNEHHEDGSVTVYCNVGIGSLLRTGFLPVMTGFQNKSVINPSSRDISDAKMRCLVKTFAFFGLGHYIFAGEDLPPDSTERQEKPKEAAKKKSAPKKAAPKKEEVEEKAVDPEPQSETPETPETPESEDSGQLPPLIETKMENAEQAALFVEFIVESAKAFCSNPSNLKDFYRQNQSQFDYLDQNFQEQYEVLKNHLHELMDSLEGVKK
tara:strand:+ start:202 stop:990 length:789 start_codon:yes stop_codon:yes gene_type:complete